MQSGLSLSGPLEGTEAKITSQRWYAPERKSIDGNGVAPDDPIEVSNEEAMAVLKDISAQLIQSKKRQPAKDRILDFALGL